MASQALRAVCIGELSVAGKQFLASIQNAGLAVFSAEPSFEKFIQTTGATQLLTVFVEAGNEGRTIIQRLRTEGRRCFIVWFGRNFTKEDLAFANEHHAFAVIETLRMDDRKISEVLRRLGASVDRAMHFEQLLHAVKAVLVQAEAEVPKPILAEIRTAATKLERYGLENELTGMHREAGPGDSGVPFHRSQTFGDALTTVGELERTGVLWVRGRLGGQEAKVGFLQGKIVSANAGDVHGEKALHRIFLWDDPRFLFTRREASEFEFDETLNVNIRDLAELGTSLKARFDRIRRELPPPELKLELEPSSMHSGAGLDPYDFSCLASIIEFGRVSRVLDYNPLPDVYLYESLIRLRRSNSIRVAA